MRDRDIRQHLDSTILAAHRGEPDTRVVHELPLCIGEARIDVAVVNGELGGYEIKSARDRLDRLPNQVRLYGGVFDRVTLVVSERHFSAARLIVPKWWGLMVVRGADVTHIETARTAKLNRSLAALSVAQLLWRDEALSVLARHGCDRGLKSKSKREIWPALTSRLPLPVLCAEVRQSLKARANWRTA